MVLEVSNLVLLLLLHHLLDVLFEGVECEFLDVGFTARWVFISSRRFTRSVRDWRRIFLLSSFTLLFVRILLELRLRLEELLLVLLYLRFEYVGLEILGRTADCGFLDRWSCHSGRSHFLLHVVLLDVLLEH